MKVKNVSVDFKGTIPTQAYGSIAVQVRWDAELEESESPEVATKELFQRIRAEVVHSVEPIAKQRAQGMEKALQGLPAKQREDIMQTGGVFNFLSMVAPELDFAKQDTPKQSPKAIMDGEGNFYNFLSDGSPDLVSGEIAFLRVLSEQKIGMSLDMALELLDGFTDKMMAFSGLFQLELVSFGVNGVTITAEGKQLLEKHYPLMQKEGGDKKSF